MASLATTLYFQRPHLTCASLEKFALLSMERTAIATACVGLSFTLCDTFPSVRDNGWKPLTIYAFTIASFSYLTAIAAKSFPQFGLAMPYERVVNLCASSITGTLSAIILSFFL